MWKRRQRLVGCGQESVHTRPPRSWSRQEDLPWSLWREHSPAHTLTLDFWPSRTSRAYISVVRSHRVYDICHSSPSESRTLATYGHSAASQTSGCTVHLDLCGGEDAPPSTPAVERHQPAQAPGARERLCIPSAAL